MSTNDTRQRGVMLTLLDLSEVLEYSTAFYKNTHPDEEGVTTTLDVGFGPYAVADTSHGLYVVNSEGVGYEVTENDPLEVEMYVSATEADGKKSFGIYPSVAVKMSPDDVREAATGEQVDLADLIRKFGARLEQNFSVWHHTLTDEG